MATLLPAFMGAQKQQQPLSYGGWALGISLDSARALTAAQIGRPLSCVGMDTKTMFCQSDPALWRHVSLYFTSVPRRLEEVSLMLPLDRGASKDSLAKWFAARWGPPIPREVIGSKKSTSAVAGMKSEVLGSWSREGMKVFSMAGITSSDTTRVLSVSIVNMERQMRLMLEQADTSAKRR